MFNQMLIARGGYILSSNGLVIMRATIKITR